VSPAFSLPEMFAICSYTFAGADVMLERAADVMMRRVCTIRRMSDGHEQELAVDFPAPYPDGEGTFFGESRLVSEMLRKRFRIVGEDEVQALAGVMWLTLEYLQHVSDGEEFLIYWGEPGDLNITDFWRYRL
jgi:hypothetical protein